MNGSLTDRQIQVIKRITSSSGQYSGLLGHAMAGTLSHDEVETLCELISNEMMMSGIEESFEPNEYGRELEALLDFVNRQRLGG